MVNCFKGSLTVIIMLGTSKIHYVKVKNSNDMHIVQILLHRNKNSISLQKDIILKALLYIFTIVLKSLSLR